MTTVLKQARAWIDRHPSVDGFLGDRTALARARAGVRTYYLFFFLLTLFMLPAWSRYSARPNFDPVWATWWASWTGQSFAAYGISATALIASLLATMWYEHRAIRIAAFLAYFEMLAFIGSFEEPVHQGLAFLYPLFVFIFLPNKISGPEHGRRYLFVFWSAQAFILLTYFLSGLGKTWNILMHSIHDPGALRFAGLSDQLSGWLLKSHHQSALADFIIAHAWLGWLLTLGMLYLFLGAATAALRPSLHRLWATGLTAFHLLTFFLMGISFFPSVAALVALFYDSPFESSRIGWRERCSELPLFGRLWGYKGNPSGRL